jgi:hypothetical protein
LNELLADLLFRDTIPWRGSPLAGQSLGGLLATVSGSGFGAAIGTYLGHGPLLLLTVPAGIVVVGLTSYVTAGVGMGLQEGLRQKVLGLFDPASKGPYQ